MLQPTTTEELKQYFIKIFHLMVQGNQNDAIKYINHYAKFRDSKDNNIFKIADTERNNMFMLSCILGVINISLFILKNYHNDFELGLINSKGGTALMLCINAIGMVDNINQIIDELLNYPDALPELTNDNMPYTSLDLVLKDTNSILSDNFKQKVLVKIIKYFLVINPNSQNFHKNLDKICQNHILILILQRSFSKDELDFDKLCSAPKQAESSNYTDVAINPNNIHNETENIREAQQVDNIQVLQPVNDMNFDANEYTPEQMESFRLQRRRGGKKYRTKRRKQHHMKTKRKKLKTKRRHYKRKRSFVHK
jgi:hypothetical protein